MYFSQKNGMTVKNTESVLGFSDSCLTILFGVSFQRRLTATTTRLCCAKKWAVFT